MITSVEINNHDARIAREDIHPRPIERGVESSLRTGFILDHCLRGASHRVQGRDVRVRGVDDVYGVEARCIRAPTHASLIRHCDVLLLRDVQARVRDVDDAGAETGIGDERERIGP